MQPSHGRCPRRPHAATTQPHKIGNVRRVLSAAPTTPPHKLYQITMRAVRCDATPSPEWCTSPSRKKKRAMQHERATKHTSAPDDARNPTTSAPRNTSGHASPRREQQEELCRESQQGEREGVEEQRVAATKATKGRGMCKRLPALGAPPFCDRKEALHCHRQRGSASTPDTVGKRTRRRIPTRREHKHDLCAWMAV